MGKVYRLHDGADGTGWFTSKIFNDEELDTILTDGKEVSNSIPSPFARIDLVNEAFRWVSQNYLEGNKAQHKLVSDALDIGQLIFYSNKFKNEIEIVDYSPKERISNHFGNVVSKHRELAKTLDVYWEQDADVFNFNKTDKVYFVLYNKEIIGATSPKSLFFSAPFKPGLRDEITLQRATGEYFGDKAIPLHKREWDFVEYLFVLAKQPQFADFFPDLYEYLDKVKEVMDSDQRRELNELTSDQLSEYDRCHVTGEVSNYCKVINYSLHTAKEKVHSIENESDFVIDSDFEVSGKKPLILPNGTFSEEWIFTTKDVKWVPNKYNGKIPDENTTDLSESTVPVLGDQYPWLSADNFLAKNIIELPYNIDSEKFVTGESNKGKKYLLPLTETLFKYFEASRVSEMLKIEELSQGTVVVKLNIKTRGGLVKFEKHYKGAEKKKLDLHFAILPFIKVDTNEIPLEYTMGIIDSDISNNKKNSYGLTCYENGKRIGVSESVIRSQGAPRAKSVYQKAESYFDAVKIELNGNVSGFVVPKMPEYNPSSESCNYAIDFGTTNTHIEYELGNNAHRAYEVADSESMWTSLFDRKNNEEGIEFRIERETFERELMPYAVGSSRGDGISFPLRTALVENKTLNKGDSQYDIYLHANNYLLYEHLEHGNDLELITNLKWEDLHEEANLKRLRAYLEHLILLIKYKSLFNNVALSNTKLTWFFPVSMSKYHKGRLSEIWSEKMEKVFGSHFKKENVRSIPESVGPYYYYYKKKGISGLTLSVDIGGGSTDVSVYDEGKVKFISSFRFAGDSIFGDGYGKDPSRNGFVNLFKDKAYEYIKGTNNTGKILNGILSRESSKDFSSYLFALSKGDGQFNYSTLIKNDRRIKLVVLLFHASLAYYIAKMMKNRGESVPVNLLFSGTAAKTVYLLDSSSDLEQVSNLYRYFFDKVYENSEKSEIRSEISDIPKELTCKGGLLSADISDQEYEKVFWLGGQKAFNQNINLDDVSSSVRFNEILDGKTKFFESEVEEFYQLLDEYKKDHNLEEYYGIGRGAYKTFKETRGKAIDKELKKGIRQTIKEQHSGDDDPVEETLFFFPLIGELSRLAFELSKER